MIGHYIHRFEELVSTNLTAFELARGGAGEGEVVVAEKQTGGRGRAGHIWESPAGNVYMSVILKRDSHGDSPPSERGLSPLLTLVAGVAVAEALDRFMKGELTIKWPNDIWIDGKKVCGILAEKGDDFVVIGIGINVNSHLSDFSPEVQKTATTLYEIEGNKFDNEKIIKAVCQELDRWYEIWRSSGFQPIKERYGFWSLLDSKVVDVTFGDEILHGVVHGIDDDGALLLQTEEGELERVIAGDVKICS